MTRSSIVHASMCDADLHLSPASTFDLIEDMVTETLGELELDAPSLLCKYGATWLFVRNRILFRDPLVWNEKFNAECFISSIRGARLMMDTVLKNGQDTICAYSRLELCAIEPDSLKIRRLSTVGFDEDIQVKEPLTELSFSRYKMPELDSLETVVSRFSDIDFNQHTNNIAYIRWLLNTYSVQQIRDHPVREIEVRYRSQSFEGDELLVEKGEEAGCEFFRISKNGSAVTECEILRG